MHTHTATITWSRGDQPFVDRRFSRLHTIAFDGGLEIPGSSSPLVLRPPISDPSAMDPEEAFVAALSSCHMLCFLAIASTRGYCVDAYHDPAEGVMDKIASGQRAMTVVTLHPEVVFSGAHLPNVDEFDTLHHDAHAMCFIANSVRTEVRCEAVLRYV